MTKQQLILVEMYVKRVMANSQDTEHNINHLERVISNALIIADKLNVTSQIDINLLKAACWLHDISYSDRLFGVISYVFEDRIVKRKLRDAFEYLNIDNEEKEIITNSIMDHCYAFPFRRLDREASLYTKILQDADGLDFFNESRKNQFLLNRKGFVLYAAFEFVANKIILYGKNHLEKFFNFHQLAKVLI